MRKIFVFYRHLRSLPILFNFSFRLDFPAPMKMLTLSLSYFRTDFFPHSCHCIHHHCHRLCTVHVISLSIDDLLLIFFNAFAHLLDDCLFICLLGYGKLILCSVCTRLEKIESTFSLVHFSRTHTHIHTYAEKEEQIYAHRLSTHPSFIVRFHEKSQWSWG